MQNSTGNKEERNMIEKKKSLRHKLNNSGAALVTVIVVIAFVSILATVLLYVSGMNYFMKTTDKKIKDSFYDAETALETVKAELMIETKNAFKAAYKEAMVSFESSGTGTTRKIIFNETFVDTLEANINTHIAEKGSLEAYLKSVVSSEYVDGLSVSSTALEVHKTDGYAILNDVSLTYTRNGYTTIITTDFLVKAPEINWSVDSSKITWDDAVDDVATAFNRETFDMMDCVIYYNWTKE